MQASITPAAMHLPCTAAMVGLRKSWIFRHRSKYMIFSCRNLPSGVSRIEPPLVGLGVADERLEVVAGREVLAVGGQDHDPDVVVGVGPVEGGVELVDELGVLGVGHLGPVHGDRRDVPVDLVLDGLECSCRPPSQLAARGAAPGPAPR